MERQAHNSLNEAALQVQLDESSRKRKEETYRKGRVGTGHNPVYAKKDKTGARLTKDDKRDMGQDSREADRVYGIRQGDIKHPSNIWGKETSVGPKGKYLKMQKAKDSKKSFADRLFSTQGAKPLKAHVEYDEVDSMVLEYFNGYFDGDLNEDTSDADIMNAVYDLIDLTEAVCDAVGLDEQGVKKAIKQQQHGAIKPALNLAVMQGSLKQGSGGVLRPREGGSSDPHLTGDLEGSAGRKAIAKMKSAREKVRMKAMDSDFRHRNWTAGVEKDVVDGKLTGRQGKEKIDRSIRTRVSPETVARTQRHINPQTEPRQGTGAALNPLPDLTPNKDYIKSARKIRDAHKAEMAKSD